VIEIPEQRPQGRSLRGIVNLMVAGERRAEPRDRRGPYAAVLTAVMSAQTSKAWPGQPGIDRR
jgi:hypothetical protein